MATWGFEKVESVLRTVSRALAMLQDQELDDDFARQKARVKLLETIEPAMRLLTFFTGADFLPEEVQLVKQSGIEGLEKLEQDRELISETRAERRQREMDAYVEDLAAAFAAFGRAVLPLLDGPASNRTTIHQLIREHRAADPRFKLIEDLTEALTMGHSDWAHYRELVREYLKRHCGIRRTA